ARLVACGDRLRVGRNDRVASAQTQSAIHRRRPGMTNIRHGLTRIDADKGEIRVHARRLGISDFENRDPSLSLGMTSIRVHPRNPRRMHYFVIPEREAMNLRLRAPRSLANARDD